MIVVPFFVHLLMQMNISQWTDFPSEIYSSFLRDLDRICYEYENVFQKVKDVLGDSKYDEAQILYNDSYDYEHDSNAPQLSQEQYKALGLIDNAIDRQHDLSYSIKIARYELHETYEELINSLYPKKS